MNVSGISTQIFKLDMTYLTQENTQVKIINDRVSSYNATGRILLLYD